MAADEGYAAAGQGNGMSGIGSQNGYVGGTAIDNLIANKWMNQVRDQYPNIFPKPSEPPVRPPPGPGGFPQPTPTPDLQGLMAQSADPWGTYGQMGVNEPYLSNINNRFGWNSQGLAYPTQLQQSPTWYNPPIVYPNVVQPPLNPKVTTGT